jgi:hypothetical protein
MHTVTSTYLQGQKLTHLTHPASRHTDKTPKAASEHSNAGNACQCLALTLRGSKDPTGQTHRQVIKFFLCLRSKFGVERFAWVLLSSRQDADQHPCYLAFDKIELTQGTVVLKSHRLDFNIEIDCVLRLPVAGLLSIEYLYISRLLFICHLYE